MLASDILFAPAVGLILIILCLVAQHVRRRAAAARRRRKYVRRPILGVDLATHHAIPFNERLPRFPPPGPAELASLDTRSFQSLCPPPSPAMNRRQFPAPGSPNQQLLSPRQRQSAQRRLPYQYPLPASLPTTPVQHVPATPPRSPALDDLAHYRSHLNSTARVDSPVRVEHAPCLPSPLALDPALGLSLPPRSPLARVARLEESAPASPTSWISTPEMPMRMEPVLPVRLPFPCPVPASPQSQTIPSNNPSPIAVCPESPRLAESPPSPAPIQSDPPATSLSISSRPLVRRSPSVPVLQAAPLPCVPEPPRPSGAGPSSGKKKTKKMKKRHSMDMCASTSPTPPSAPQDEAKVIGPPKCDTDSKTAEANANTVAEDKSCRLPLSDVHNTPPGPLSTPTKQDTPDPSRIHLAALISPSKAPRRVERGPNPVYHYHPEAPAVAVSKSVARPVQDEFKNFSAGLAANFGRRGWAETGPNELAPPKKNKKKKKKVVAKPSAPHPSPVTLRSVFPPPSPTTVLLPAFEQNCANYFVPTPTGESSRFVIDLTLPSGMARGLVERVSSEMANTGCHPDCGDIYCPGGCSGIKCE